MSAINAAVTKPERMQSLVRPQSKCRLGFGRISGSHLSITTVENARDVVRGKPVSYYICIETERQGAAREAETMKERHDKTKKKMRQFRERLARVPSRMEQAIQGAVKAQGQTSTD